MEDLFNFENEGFKNIVIHFDENVTSLRTNVACKEEFERWKEIYSFRTNSCFNSRSVLPVTGRYKTFRKRLVCHHGMKHANKKKTATGCKVQMDVTIRAVHEKSTKDKLLKEFPCFITIKGQHNHSTQSAEALGQLRLLPSIKNTFLKYFELGLTAAQAQRHHLMKMELIDDLSGQANHSISPTYKSIASMRAKWMKNEQCSLNNRSVFDAIKHYANKNKEVTIKVDKTDNNSQVIVALVTPFMRRAHKELREAGEVVFVDASACVEPLNIAVIPLLCSGPAGAVPLGMLFTPSQDEATLMKGFNMIKNCLGESAFYGRGTPQAFVTDNCEPERKAIASTWPDAQLCLCIFHILQQGWHWLLDSKHGVAKNHQQELMAVMKALAYADTPSTFSQQWDSFQKNPLAEKYPNFTRYLAILIHRKAEWSIPFRGGVVLQGHHTSNNYCEATMFIIKDVLSRCKAYNTAQLIVFITEIFDIYMQQRLLDVALKRRHVKPINTSKLPLDAVSSMDDGKFLVQSESQTYEVDLSIGMCTCTQGAKGAICKHQVTCAEYNMTMPPEVFALSDTERQWLAALAVGVDRVSEESFFKNLCGQGHSSLGRQTEQMEIISNIDGESSNLNKHETFGHGSVNFYITFVTLDTQCTAIAQNIDQISVGYDLSYMNESTDMLEASPQSNAESLVRTLIEMVRKLGNEESLTSMSRLQECLKAVKTSTQFNSLLIHASSTQNTQRGEDYSHGNIPCQTSSISRRSLGVPRGAATILMGRRPPGAVVDEKEIKGAQKAEGARLKLKVKKVEHASVHEHEPLCEPEVEEEAEEDAEMREAISPIVKLEVPDLDSSMAAEIKQECGDGNFLEIGERVNIESELLDDVHICEKLPAEARAAKKSRSNFEKVLYKSGCNLDKSLEVHEDSISNAIYIKEED